MGERTFVLADLGEGLTEAEVVHWRVAVGDVVTMNQVLLEVETAKAAVEIPSPWPGTVVALLAAEGTVVPVGGGLVRLAVDLPDEPSPASPPQVLVGSGPIAREPGRHERRAAANGGHSLASPAVRARARELGVDLATIVGTGTDGIVTREDLERAAPASAPAPLDEPGVTRTPIRSIRRETAATMVRSAFTAPHVTEWVSADVTELVQRIDEVRHAPASAGRPITIMVFAARALLRAIAKYPDINASWDGARNEIVQYAHVNLGVATSTKRGLLVPNIPHADELDFHELADAISDLVSHARNGDTTLERMTHGTITITNIGGFGVDGGTPLLNPPEAAILLLGQMREMPWVVEHALAVRWVMTLALTFDHRLVDGALGSRVLREVADLLEHPAPLMPET